MTLAFSLRAPLGTLALLSGALLWASAAAKPLDAERFQAISLETGRVDHLLIEDFNGDGLKDLLAVHGRDLRVWFAKADGYKRDPDQRFTFDAAGVFFDAADIDGDHAAELVYVVPTGARFYRAITGSDGLTRFQRGDKDLIASAAVFTEPDPGEILPVDFCLDLDGDGDDDLLFPKRGRFVPFMRANPGVFEERTLALSFQMESDQDIGPDRLQGKMRQSFRYPRVMAGDFNGDGARDVALAQGDLFSVFLQRDGAWPEEPNYQVPLDRAHESPFGQSGDRQARRRMPLLDAPLQLEDIDGDRVTDLVLTNTFGGRVELFLGKEYRRRLDTPDQVVGIDGWIMITRLRALSGGAERDLIIGTVDELGIWDLLKIFLSKEVSARVQIFRDQGARFSPRPDFKREMIIPLNFASTGSGLDVGFTVFMKLDGDFTRDGRTDLVMRSADDELSFYPGTPGGVFSEKPLFTQRIPGIADFKNLNGECADLNGDGMSDLVLRYTGWKRSDDFLCVLWSKK